MTDANFTKIIKEANSDEILAAILAQGGVDTSGIPGDTPPSNRGLIAGVASTSKPSATANGKIVELYIDEYGILRCQDDAGNTLLTTINSNLLLNTTTVEDVETSVDENKAVISSTQAANGATAATNSNQAGAEVRTTPPTALTDGAQGS